MTTEQKLQIAMDAGHFMLGALCAKVGYASDLVVSGARMLRAAGSESDYVIAIIEKEARREARKDRPLKVLDEEDDDE